MRLGASVLASGGTSVWTGTARLDARRAESPETANGCVRGAKLWRENPMSGSGLKHGQQVSGNERARRF
jgi:hypothetical protein